MLHIPILRAGQPYKSLNTVRVAHFQTGEPFVEVSQANTGLISKDLTAAKEHRNALETLTVSELIVICKRAAHVFSGSNLMLDDEHQQSPEDYIRQTSATTGMPEVLCRKNMAKIHLVLDNMESVLYGLTRGLNLSVLDNGYGMQNGHEVSYLCLSNVLGAILPNNSPGVHTLWLPSLPLKVPVILKPGREEPWTPYRIAQAFIQAGCPPEAFGFYPTDHSGATEIMLRCDRLILFGDESTVSKWAGDRRVQVHGPGRSKLLIGNDKIAEWYKYSDVMVTSALENGGRSCINASGVWVPAHGKEIALHLAKRLVKIDALPMDHPHAQIAAFVNPQVAQRISELIDRYLQIPGAEDMTAKLREGGRLIQKDGCTFLLPTVIWCEDPEHPLANIEFLFPYISVIETHQEEMPHRIGPTLVVTALTENKRFIDQLLSSRNVDRLNIGPVPTNQVSWYQPHEGNLFEHLYRQRSLQTV
ncbi:aldehyde dehydrogenase family protein [bacterium]|nr:aldehyde dehydrogenase family protein [bacterium]MCI0601620.1 aldehyde dehydrogenase family protein [bacterium]